MSAMHRRFLPFALIVAMGLGAGTGIAPASAGVSASAAPAAAKARVAKASVGKARVAKGAIVPHANSKYSAAELAKMRPHYTTLKPRARTNTE